MNQIALLHDKIKTLEQLLDVQEQTVIDQIGKLAESENSFREMFEITSEGVALISSQTGKFIAANPAACRLLDYSEEEFLELHPEDITPAAAKEIMRKTLRTIAEGGMVPDHEGLCVRKDGTNVNVIVSNRHMSWKGEPVFFVGFKDNAFRKLPS